MATTKLVLPTLDELRTRYITDVARMVPGKNVARGSDTYGRGTAVASAAQMVMARQVALQDAQMADTSTGDDLIRLCGLNGVEVSGGAGAAGSVLADCTGTVTYPVDLEGKADDGLRYQVVGTTAAVNGGQVPIIGRDVGKRTNKAAGTKITWTSPPAGSNATATVDVDGLRFGVDADTEVSLRRKLKDALRHPRRNSNWAAIAKDAEDSSAAIEKAFVYPALYGPSTMHIAVAVAADADEQYTREAPGSIVLIAANAVIARHPEHVDLTTTTVSNWDVDVILKISIPNPKAEGGAGGGWKDLTASRWPRALNAVTPYAVRLYSAPTNPKQIVVVSDTEPVVDAHIAIWSSTAKALARTRIRAVTGSASPYTVDLYEPIAITDFVTGDGLMADADHLDEYCATVAAAFAALGPGEKTTVAAKLPRAYRRPRVNQEWPSDFSSKQTDVLSTKHAEISHVAFYRAFDSASAYTALPIACPVVSTVGTAPYILRLGKVAFYEV